MSMQNKGQGWVSQEPVCLRAPEHWVHPAGAHLGLKGKCQDFCSRNSVITSSRLVHDQIAGILLQNTALQLSAFMISLEELTVLLQNILKIYEVIRSCTG